MAYDAENRIRSVVNAPAAGGGWVNYSYDANGKRVIKQYSDGGTVFYVYDAFGQLAAEYSSAAKTTNPACGTCYLTTDHLGSTRLITDEGANVIARHDFLPFGEEIPAGTAGRDGTFGLNASVNQKFTGKERDVETGLDYFFARYLSAQQGRFLSVDPANAGASLTDPQSWNGYSYVRNSPLGLVDPSGMDPFDGNDTGDCGDDPFCGWAYWPPPIILPPIIDTPVPQIPAPPSPPTPIAIQNTTGVYAQGQWGGVSNSILPGGPVLVGTGGTPTIVIDIIGGTICVGTGVCEAIAIGAGAVALGAAAYIIYRTHANGAKSNQSTASKSKVTDAVREECEQYAHSRADRYGHPRYPKQWIKDYATCIAHGGIENIPD